MSLLSAIIISPDGYATVGRLTGCLAAQTVRSEMELVYVFPSKYLHEAESLDLEGFAAIQTVAIDNMESTARARAAGVRAARSPVVAFTEDHSLPDPDWAEAFLRAHQNDWAVVGPAVKNGNPLSLLSWANFLIEYSDWLDPAPGGEMHHLPGHNSAYKRDVLLGYGADLDWWLEVESLIHWDLCARGHRIWLEPAARTNHLNYSRFGASLKLRFYAGRLLAGMRRRPWSVCLRAVYALGSPLIPLVRLSRIFGSLCRPGRPLQLFPRVLPAMLILLAMEAVGEMTGYIFGPGNASKRIAQADFHRERFMNAKDRKHWADS
jgi:hypothetical protein